MQRSERERFKFVVFQVPASFVHRFCTVLKGHKTLLKYNSVFVLPEIRAFSTFHNVNVP